MSVDIGVKLSFPVDQPLGVEAVMPLTTADGAWYQAHYRYELRGSQWWSVLKSIEEIMPALTPQADWRVLGDDARLHMMDEHGAMDFTAEAKQRRREWREVNGVALRNGA